MLSLLESEVPLCLSSNTKAGVCLSKVKLNEAKKENLEGTHTGAGKQMKVRAQYLMHETRLGNTATHSRIIPFLSYNLSHLRIKTR